MPRARSPNRDRAYEIFKEHDGKIENRRIAEMLEISEKTVGGWKCKDDWSGQMNGVLQTTKRSTPKRKQGGQPGNKNATGPPGNRNAEKFGFFSKYLPDETKDIFDAVKEADPLDLLWHQVQIAYAAIIRAQKIMYVKDIKDKTTERVEERIGKVSGEKWEVQQAWDKQASFLKAQARAQGELRSLIKQYDQMLHANWDMVTEEQKARIEALKAKAYEDDPGDAQDDGFLGALNGSATEDWGSEED